VNKLVLLPVLAFAGGLSATAPSYADVKADYMAACLAASGQNTELCTCKTTEAGKLADDEMLGFIVIALKDNSKFREMVNKGEVPQKVLSNWPIYVRESNEVCVPPN